MINVLHIVGARPQFIKLQPLHKELASRSIKQNILHTGQHFDENMSDIFFNEMGIPEPDYNLDIHSLSHGAMTGRMMEGIESILIDNNFDYVIVYGDTNSTLAGAISARKLNIKIIHVESGVRNNDFTMPEEVNRVLTDNISDILLCPTQHSVDNLVKESIHGGINVGDLMYDAALMHCKQDATSDKPYVLVTCHRQENTTREALTEIIKALNAISLDINIIFPIHPRTQNVLQQLDIKPTFELSSPVGYIEMLKLISNSKYIITDSGGVSREAYFFNKPNVVLLEKPVWPEIPCLTSSAHELDILANYCKLKEFTFESTDIFGDGNARKKIADIIEDE